MTNKQIVDQPNGNGKRNGNSATQVKDLNTVWVPPEQTATPLPHFEPDNQPIILERPSWWSHAFVWIIIAITGSALAWAALAPIEQSVPATGKLEAEGAAREVKAPTGGVIREILVKGGDVVTKGQVLVRLDPTGQNADLESLTKQRESLLKENQFYNAQSNGTNLAASPPEFQELIRSKATLMAENQYYKALLNGAKVNGGGGEFFANQEGLLSASRAELRSRVEAGRLQIQGLETQLAQTNVQLAAIQAQLPMVQQQLLTAKDRLGMAKLQLATAKAQLPNSQQRLVTNRQLLASDEALFQRLKPVVEAKAISELQAIRQQQQVLTRRNDIQQSEADVLNRYNEIAATQGEIANRQSEISSRETEILKTQAEMERLKGEQRRISVEINRAKQQLKNTIDLSAKDIFAKIAGNHQRIAEIDSQIARLRLENKKRLDEIESQLAKAKQAVEYRELVAPVDGVVFNVKPTGPGYVVREIDADPVLTIVPNDKLVASVSLTNRDIGFVREGMDVQVNVEPFPSTEFGTISGKVVSIGKDVLNPTQERPYYAFPVRISLDKQTLHGKGKDYNLQSGMAVNTSIKVRDRTVLSIFTELFQKQVDSLESVR